MKNEKNTYYTSEDDSRNQDILARRKREHKKIIIILVAIFLILAGVLRIGIFNEQHFWSDDLVSAIEQEDVIEVKKLLENEEMDVNRRGGGTLLFWFLNELSSSRPIEVACWTGDYEIVKLLIDRGADPRLDSGLYADPLFVTLEEYHEDSYAITKLLLEHGANPNVEMEQQETPLFMAANLSPIDYEAEGVEEVYDEEKGEDIVRIYKLLQQHSKEKNPKAVVGYTLLTNAVLAKNQALVQYLLKEQQVPVDVNEKDEYGLTVLFYLCDFEDASGWKEKIAREFLLL